MYEGIQLSNDSLTKRDALSSPAYVHLSLVKHTSVLRTSVSFTTWASNQARAGILGECVGTAKQKLAHIWGAYERAQTIKCNKEERRKDI